MEKVEHGSLDPMIAGTGEINACDDSCTSLKIAQQGSGYALAQLDDYHTRARRDFRWRPPLHLGLEAHASLNEPPGTLGFGFWNDPFSFSLGQSGAVRRFPSAPQAVWFFYGSPPNDMALAPPVPGHGWKAAVLRSPRVPAALLAPAAAIAVGAAQFPFLRRAVMNAAIATVRAQEKLLSMRLDQIHQYELLWDEDRVRWCVDGELVMQSEITPHPPLGFVAWIDNQYAIASPTGGFRFGVLPVEQPQSLVIRDLEVNGAALQLA